MVLKSVVVFVLAAILSTVVLAEDDVSSQGSFHGDVSDGSDLKSYNAFLEKFGYFGRWLDFTTFASPYGNVKFKSYAGIRSDIVAIVKENGGAEIPPYDVDSLNLEDTKGYREYAKKAMSDSSFKPSGESCGAAVTFVIPAAVGVLLFDKRPNYVEGRYISADDRKQMGDEYGIQLGKDLKSLIVLCASQDPKVNSGLSAFLTNFSSDIVRVLPAADKNFAVQMTDPTFKSVQSPPLPYMAIISCGMNGQNYNVLACFKSTDLKITTSEGGKLYKIYNLPQAGFMRQDGLHIPLPEHFELEAQNSQATLVMTVAIQTAAGKVVYSDQQGQFGVVHVTN
jgi:hypothetical protein